MAETPPDPGSAPPQPKRDIGRLLRGTRESCGGQIVAAAAVLVFAVYGALHLSSGRRIRPERVSLVPKSLLEPVSTGSSAVSPSTRPVAPRDTKSKSTVLWPQTKGPGPYGL